MNFISRIIKSINAMRERLKIERHEAMYGPHFNEECALKAVSKMENEDGSRGEHQVALLKPIQLCYLVN